MDIVLVSSRNSMHKSQDEILKSKWAQASCVEDFNFQWRGWTMFRVILMNIHTMHFLYGYSMVNGVASFCWIAYRLCFIEILVYFTICIQNIQWINTHTMYDACRTLYGISILSCENTLSTIQIMLSYIQSLFGLCHLHSKPNAYIYDLGISARVHKHNTHIKFNLIAFEKEIS